MVKLQDRLYYLLQPPLDLLVGSGQLNFPFDPFAYQLDGIAFLFPRYAGILADEMGLGKTMQAISTIRLLLCSAQLRSVLLVCPKPLVTNWLREFQVWAPEIPVVAIEGNATKREFQWRSPEVPVKVANYELLMRDRETVIDSGLHFDLVVLDEAQRIKNRNSTTSEIVRAIPRTRSWALTGTPVENSPDDLVGIFDFLSPGYLKTGMPMTEMAKASGDYILRRTKEMVMSDMPPKLFRDAELDLTPEQWATYESAENEGVIQLEELEQPLTIQHVFELVLRLKQICNFDPVTGSSVKLERLVADMEEVAASGKKAIVFSQWVNSIDKMKPALERFGPLEYHGRIPHKQARRRDRSIQERSQVQRDPDELRCGKRRIESAVQRIRFLVRPLVESCDRGPGDQSRTPHWRQGCGDGDTHAGDEYDRTTYRGGAGPKTRDVRHVVCRIGRRSDQRRRTQPRRNLRPLRSPRSRRKKSGLGRVVRSNRIHAVVPQRKKTDESRHYERYSR